MAERKTPVTLPTGEKGEGVEVQVEESTERWSEFKLQDGAVIRLKATVTSAVRVDGQYDQQGNPMYVVNLSPVLMLVSAPEKFHKKI
jgi:hypothetical protein